MKRFSIIDLSILCTIILLQPAVYAFGQKTSEGLFFNVIDYGAVNDGMTKNTESIRKAIDAAVKAGGGTIYFPAGEYMTGAIHLKSNITLFIDAGAVLKFSQDFDDYLPMVKTRWEGTECVNFSPFIYAYQCDNITIRGRGTLDGQGKAWWDYANTLKNEWKNTGTVIKRSKWQDMCRELNKNTIAPDKYNWTLSHFLRPPFIQPYECTNILIEEIKIIDSPWWTINPVYCNNVTIDRITIINPEESPNGDGINPDACKNVHISNCTINAGDDCIAIKSGRDEDGRRVGRSCENITITNCLMLEGHGGVVIGSEMSGDVRNITISNCVFDGTLRGIRLKTTRGRGGIVERIRVNNIVMQNIGKEAIKLNMFYKNVPPEPVSERTPQFRNIHISNVTAEAQKAGFVLGLEEMPVEDITFSNINVTAEKGFSVSNARNVEFHNIQINTSEGPSLVCQNVTNLEIADLKTSVQQSGVPVVELKDVQNAFIYGCSPVLGIEIFLKVSGSTTSNIVLRGNNFTSIKSPVVCEKDVKEGIIKQNE